LGEAEIEMKQARIVRAFAVAVLVGMLLFALPAMVFGEIVPPAEIGVSSTNPNTGDGAWRGGWGNSLWPQYTFATISGANGFYYLIDRTPGSVMDTSAPEALLHSAWPQGTSRSQTLDIAGTYNVPPVGGWGYSVPGMQDEREGTWIWHFAFYGVDAATGATDWSQEISMPVKLDFHAPTAVTGVKVSGDPSIPAATSAVGKTSRVTVSWDGLDYDGLAGTGYYTLYVDGVASASGLANGAANVDVYNQPPFWYSPLWTLPYNYTIEDLSPGRHTFQLCATDKATNVGPLSAAAVFVSDPDVPTIAITSPVGSVLGVRPSLAVDAADGGGVKSVSYYLDGTLIGTTTTAPYALRADLSAFAAGGHTLSATVTDMADRTATASKSITLDKKPLTLTRVRTSVSGGRVRITFTVSRPSIVDLQARYSGSTKVISRSYSRAGRYTLQFTVPRSASYPKRLTSVPWTLNAEDSIGNVSGTPHGTAKIVNWRIVRLSQSSARIKYR
jgi:hypothetical protein